MALRRGYNEPRDYYDPEALGHNCVTPIIDTIYRRVHTSQTFLVMHRFYGPIHITWDLLTPVLRRLWLVVFDTILNDLLDRWKANVLTDWRIRRTFRRRILGRLREIVPRARVLIPN